MESEEEESSHESDLEEVLEVNQQGSVIIEEVVSAESTQSTGLSEVTAS